MSFTHLGRIAALTAVLATAGLAITSTTAPALAEETSEDPEPPPGYVHTGESWHTGIWKYFTETNPDGTTVHVKKYLTLYRLKKKPVPTDG